MRILRRYSPPPDEGKGETAKWVRNTSWNAAAARLFGYGAEEMIGQSSRRLLPEDRQGEGDQILVRLRRGERVDHFETVRQTIDGRLLDVSVTSSPVRD